MKKTISAIIILAFLPINSFSLEVNVEELQKTKKIKFINYKGKYKRKSSVREIKAIGRGLARESMRKGANRKVRFKMKYSIIHAVSKKEPEKFSADIFSIDRDARVGHIKNVRRIISGYLETRYSYSKKNAEILSYFTTYYNAIYRGNLSYYSKKYKKAVTRHLKKRNAGIAIKYTQWPGKTRIVIPLSDKPQRGKLDSIDLETISDKKVIKKMRKNSKNLEKRKGMIDLRKKSLEKKKEENKKKEEKLKEKKKELKKKEEKKDKKLTDIIKKKKEIAEKKIKAEKEKDPKKKKKLKEAIKKDEKKLKKDRKEYKKLKDETTKDKEEIKKEEEKVKKDEKKIETSEKSIKEEEENIKKDEEKANKDPEKREEELDEKEKKLEEKEKKLKEQEDRLKEKKSDKNIIQDKLYYLKIKEYLSKGHYNNHMYMINAATRKVMFKSPVTNICGKKYITFSGGVVVITHPGQHTAGHHLKLLDTEKLEAKKSGKDNIFWRSFIEIRDSNIYAIIIVDNDYYLGKFDKDLKLLMKSNVKISRDTFISFYGKNIYINRHDKQIMALNKEDLKLIEIVKP